MNKPSWLENAVFYNIYPQSFYDSNADGIGDLNGIREKLPYIHDMGFTALWLNPFYESPFRDAGYDVTDYYKVAPRYGTNDDFRALCESAHQLGMKVCIDIVPGHTSLECKWFQESAKPEKNEYTNRYIWTDKWTKAYGDMCIGGYSQRNGMYMKNFFYCQPAINYGFAQIDDPSWQLPPDHPDCLANRQELVSVMQYWMSLGADGFRVDMASYLIKNDPDCSANQALWREIRKLFDAEYPECALISEWSQPSRAIPAGFHIDFMIHMNLAGYTKLFRAEPGHNFDERYDGRSYFNRDGNGSIEEFLQDYLQEYDATKGKGYIAIPTGNHDIPRISYGRSQPELEVAYAFLLTMPGVPFVYYGDEIGMPYRADIPSKEGGFNRTGSRTPMQWADGKNAGFSEADTDKLYLPVDEHGVNVSAQMSDENSLLHTMKKLIALRKSSPALCADGEIEFVNRRHNGYPLVYRRWLGRDEFLICINPLDVPEAYLVGEGWQMALANQDATIEQGQLTLKPFGYVILKKKV